MEGKEKKMGRFSVPIEVANYGDVVAVDEGRLAPAKIRRTIIDGVVDPGASRLVLPEALVKELGLPDFKSKTKLLYADGRRGIRREVGGVFLTLQGRHGLYPAIVEPKRTTALIGAIVLVDLDFLVDCKIHCLVPRDPHFVLSGPFHK